MTLPFSGSATFAPGAIPRWPAPLPRCLIARRREGER